MPNPGVESAENERLLRIMSEAVREDFAISRMRTRDSEALSLHAAIEQRVLALLEEIASHAKAAYLRPNLPLRLSIDEQPVQWDFVTDKEFRRIGFFATTGDPTYWGHIYLALLGIVEMQLDTVIFQVMGDHPHKRDTKLPKEHRHAIARHALSLFHPLIRYTPLGFGNLKIGEENAAELLLLNYDLPIELYYIAGADVHAVAARNLAACRTLLIPRDGSEPRRLFGLFLPRGESPTSDSTGDPSFIKWANRLCEPFPTVRGMHLSSTMFRRDPSIPILPVAALQYVDDLHLCRSEKAES